jgi:hypothetical protein
MSAIRVNVLLAGTIVIGEMTADQHSARPQRRRPVSSFHVHYRQACERHATYDTTRSPEKTHKYNHQSATANPCNCDAAS